MISCIIDIIEFIAIALCLYVLYQRQEKLKRLCEWHTSEQWVKNRIQESFIKTTGITSGLLIRIESLEKEAKDRSSFPRELLELLGGRVEECYQKDGRLTKISITAPWLDEPLCNSIFPMMNSSEMDHYCKAALVRFTSKLQKKK